MKRLTGTILASVLAAASFACPMSNVALATDYTQEEAVSTVLAQLSADEKQQFDFVAQKLGFEDTEDYLSNLDLTRDSFPLTNRLKDIDCNGSIGTGDIAALSLFLEAKVKFSYDYACLDMTGEGIVDLADLTAFTDYYTYSLLGLITIPNNISCYGNAPTYSSSNREYMKHAFGSSSSTDRNDASNDTYYLYTSFLPTTGSSPMTSVNNRSVSLNERETFEDTQTTNYNIDSRVILLGGTGSVIGKHQILVAAHEVITVDHDGTPIFHTTCIPHAYKYLSGSTVLEASLTPTYFHVPTPYIAAVADEHSKSSSQWDYAIIEVSEDLEHLYFNNTYSNVNLGKFNLGLALDDAVNDEYQIHARAFPSVSNRSPEYPWTLGREYVYATGILAGCSPDGKNLTYSGLALSDGASGAGVCTTTAYSNTNYESIIGNYLGGGIRVTLPILHFASNNPNLTTS
jgi:hypothetical protein